MRIGNTSGINKAAELRKKKGASSADGSFKNLLDAPEETSAPASLGNAPAVQLSGILALNEALPYPPRVKQQLERGHNLLDELEILRLDLLYGHVTANHALRLTQRIREQHETIDDPKLEDILRSIELRCEVELAKLEAAQRRS